MKIYRPVLPRCPIPPRPPLKTTDSWINITKMSLELLKKIPYPANLPDISLIFIDKVIMLTKKL